MTFSISKHFFFNLILFRCFKNAYKIFINMMIVSCLFVIRCNNFRYCVRKTLNDIPLKFGFISAKTVGFHIYSPLLPFSIYNYSAFSVRYCHITVFSFTYKSGFSLFCSWMKCIKLPAKLTISFRVYCYTCVISSW